MTDHQILVKITEVGDQPGERSEDRVGDVLVVRTVDSADNVHGGLSQVPKDAAAVVRVVTQNPTLDAGKQEVVSKGALIGRTWIETIEVGVTVPA